MTSLRAGPSRRPAAIAAVVVLALSVVVASSLGLIGASPALAMTQVGSAQGYPGDTVQVQVQNQRTGPAETYWVINAPAGTSIVSASGNASSGLSPFSCTGAGAVTRCGPSSNGGWGVNNIVTLQIAIASTAPAGTVSGTSAITTESAPYSVTVLPPPAPAITAPAPSSQTLATEPPISGTKRAGNAASVTADGSATPLCTVAADAATTWTCTPTTPLAAGTHTLTATQSSPAGDVSPPSDPVSFAVLEPAALAVAQSGPAEAVPTVTVTREVAVTNPGPGTALGTSLTVDLGGFPATTCTIDGTATDCPALAGGVTLGDLAAGSTTTIALTGSVLAGTAVGTTYTIQASASTVNDAASPVASSSTVTVAAPGPPRITHPATSTSTTDRTPTIAGVDALPGATVSVSRGGGVVCSARADAAGDWSCSPSVPLAYGLLRVGAVASIGGADSRQSVVIQFTVVPVPVKPPPTPPVPPAPAPPAASPSPAPAPPVAAAPVAPAPAASATPAPGPGPGGSGSDGSGSGGSGSGPGSGSGGSGSANSPLPLDLRLSVNQIQPGTVAALRGTLGPNALAKPSAVTLSAFISPGMIYRTVSIVVGDRTIPCTTGTTTFSCDVTLAKGESADVEIRIYADPLNAPALSTQQLTLTSSAPAQSNALTTTMALAGAPNDTQQYADQLTTFDITTFPGAFIPLLSMLLLALAATVAEAGRRRRRAATPSQPSSNPPGSDS